MPGFKMLAFKVWRGEVLSKTFESYISPPNSYFQKYSNNAYFKNSTKSCPDYF